MEDRDVAEELARVKRTYEEYGARDPHHAVLTHERFRGGAAREELFASGEREIDEVLERLDALGVRPAGGRALDFGCGVGRLSQALARHFERVVGLDIAASMVEAARSENRHGERVEYRVNDRADLSQLDDASFDFAYSSITLQHVPPEATRRYLPEMLRVLAADGVAVFQVPNERERDPTSLAARWRRFRRGPLRRAWKRLRGKPTVEMHALARSTVERLVTGAGGRLVEVADVGRRPGRNYRYTVVKDRSSRDATRPASSSTVSSADRPEVSTSRSDCP